MYLQCYDNFKSSSLTNSLRLTVCEDTRQSLRQRGIVVCWHQSKICSILTKRLDLHVRCLHCFHLHRVRWGNRSMGGNRDQLTSERGQERLAVFQVSGPNRADMVVKGD